MKKSVKAYAKINLYLDVVSRRDNGYHDIKGIMQKVSLCDTVTLTITPAEQNEIRITCTNPCVPTDEKNIAYKATAAFLSEFSVGCYKVDIDIEKNIPAAGGLAGGSTDAAATLNILSELLGAPADKEALMSLASRLGADVPFCLAEGSMITEGIGDILTPVASLENCFILITNTGESVSTPQAYAKLDEIYGGFCETCFDADSFNLLCRGLEEKDLAASCAGMYNIFEDVVLRECTLAAGAKKIIGECGALGAMMSGSGPSVFGIFDSCGAAERACEKLKSLGYDTHICTPVI